MKIAPALIIGILISTSLRCQSQNDNFMIGDFIEVFENDSISIYYNCTGTVVAKRCAEFIRIGKIDSININVSGKFHDYYIDGKLALEATMENDYLNGKATYYYENGQVKSSGKYKQDKKVGVWTYYYENGTKNKVINYVSDYPFIAEYYNKKGKQKVVAGMGNYEGEFYPFKGCTPFTIWGEVKNGKMEGKWTLYDSHYHLTIGYEFFEDGYFIRGESGTDTYNDYQRIAINGFCANENLHLEDNLLGCPGDKGIFYPEYKNGSLLSSFYPELLVDFSTILNENLHNQWLIIGLEVSRENLVDRVNIKSSINDIRTENAVYELIKSNNDFSAAKMNGEAIDFDLFFTVLIRNDQIIIPAEYIYRNRSTDR